jgi:2-oxoglutarate dehydrogenase complex dehydrogenase (E1) component-like enzyme
MKKIILTESQLIKMIERIIEETKGEKWIQSAMKKPGALKKSMGKGKAEKISTAELDKEMSKLKKKDTNPDKKGIQGLNKSDLTKLKRINFAKTLKKLK